MAEPMRRTKLIGSKGKIGRGIGNGAVEIEQDCLRWPKAQNPRRAAHARRMSSGLNRCLKTPLALPPKKDSITVV